MFSMALFNEWSMGMSYMRKIRILRIKLLDEFVKELCMRKDK